jgi:predicted naringenin-chalcone synthase
MIDPVGFRVILSRSLPRFVEQKRRFIKAAQLQAPQLICHPGGAKVLARLWQHVSANGLVCA